MIVTCLVNNYNYARFVGEAVDSALRQSTAFNEILVVDDGSTDGSAELLEARYALSASVQLVRKPNQGQLSCFNEGFARASGDVVFFLDSDDVYEPHYVERVLEIYRHNPGVDFISCGYRRFGQRDEVHLEHPHDRDLGYSVILTSYGRDWIGASTSCLSMRRGVLEKILPLPFTPAWRIRADDCLVFGASLAGARKYYVAEPLVRRRRHGQNVFDGRTDDKFAVYRRRVAINSLFEHLQRKFCYDMRTLAEAHHREFCTIGRPTFRELVKYARIGGASRLALLRRLSCLAVMTAYYVRSCLRPEPAASPVALHEAGTPPARQRRAA